MSFPIWTFGFNLIVNSFFSFLTSVLLVSFFAILFRIKNNRAKAILFTLPFFKIIFDLFQYSYSNWAITNGSSIDKARMITCSINPFIHFQFSLENGNTFSIADFIATFIDPFWIPCIVIIALIGMGIKTLFSLLKMRKEKKELGVICTATQEKIGFIDSMHSPFVYLNKIWIPKTLHKELTESELNAVLAHEKAHIFWKDSLFRSGIYFVRSFFWWIPSKWWEKKVEETQELAADDAIENIGFSKKELASALLKTIKLCNKSAYTSFGGASLKKRIKNLQTPSNKISFFQIFLLCFSAVAILFGTLWTF